MLYIVDPLYHQQQRIIVQLGVLLLNHIFHLILQQ